MSNNANTVFRVSMSFFGQGVCLPAMKYALPKFHLKNDSLLMVYNGSVLLPIAYQLVCRQARISQRPQQAGINPDMSVAARFIRCGGLTYRGRFIHNCERGTRI